MIMFLYPLAFLALIIPFIYRELTKPIKGMHGDALKVPKAFFTSINNIKTKSKQKTGKSNLSKNDSLIKFILLYIIWILITISAARPQIVGEPISLRNHSREILLVLDISTSMLERDFVVGNRRIDRITAVKNTASSFIKKRANDKFGLILFGTNAYLQAPMTYDKKSIEEILLTMDAGMAGNSTAIGDALGLALKVLRKSGNLDKKMIILLTDGENNDGSLNIPEVISLAKKEGIKIYTIGVGSGDTFARALTGFGIRVGNSGLDEKSLKEIAQATKGTYFRADDTKSLEMVYKAIDELEPSQNEDVKIQEVRELYYYPLIIALIIASLLVLLSRRMR